MGFQWECIACRAVFAPSSRCVCCDTCGVTCLSHRHTVRERRIHVYQLERCVRRLAGIVTDLLPFAAFSMIGDNSARCRDLKQRIAAWTSEAYTLLGGLE